MIDRISRRSFVQLGAAAVTVAAGGGLAARVARASSPATSSVGSERGSGLGQPSLVETDIAELQRLMRRRKLSSVDITAGYLERIAELNPVLHAIIETNPDALAIAARLDRERRRGHLRGPLHGIPVVLKDNIATDDRMETTAGSLALVGSKVRDDAQLVRQLRRAGAVVIGKANLSEWANFRGGNADFPPINGWSARGGFTRNPYLLDLDPCGSSSGSAAAAAASLCAVAVGTETDGSILCPAGEQSIVGIKPTVGLVSGSGVIPIARSQDTAGPMTRTVREAALLLDALRVPGRKVMGRRVPDSYVECLDRHALRGARLAYDRRYVDGDLGPGDPDTLALVDEVLEQLRSRGAEVVDITTADPFAPDGAGRIPWDDEFTVLLYEFKVQIAEYLAGLRHTDLRTLADLIAFNVARCDEELVWFGQEVFEAAEATSGDLTDPEYLAALATNQGFGRSVIDGALAEGFDAIITPSFSFGTSPAAVSGYPSMAVPIGSSPGGRPIGLWLAAGFMQEPALIRLAYAIEQLVDGRVAPQLLGAVPPDPAPFPGCAAPAPAAPSDGPTTLAPEDVGSDGQHPHGAAHRHPRHW